MSTLVSTFSSGGGNSLKNPIQIFQALESDTTAQTTNITIPDIEHYVSQGYTHMLFTLELVYKAGDSYTGGGKVGDSFLPLQLVLKLNDLQMQGGDGVGGNGYEFAERILDNNAYRTAYPYGVYYGVNSITTTIGYIYPSKVNGLPSIGLQIVYKSAGETNGTRAYVPTIYIM